MSCLHSGKPGICPCTHAAGSNECPCCQSIVWGDENAASDIDAIVCEAHRFARCHRCPVCDLLEQLGRAKK